MGGCLEALEGDWRSGVVGEVEGSAAMAVFADDAWMRGGGRRGWVVVAAVEKLAAGWIEKGLVDSGGGDADVVGGAGTAVAAVVGTIGTPALLVLRDWSRQQWIFRLDESVVQWSFGW